MAGAGQIGDAADVAFDGPAVWGNSGEDVIGEFDAITEELYEPGGSEGWLAIGFGLSENAFFLSKHDVAGG